LTKKSKNNSVITKKEVNNGKDRCKKTAKIISCD
jgi:hypothetical protein